MPDYKAMYYHLAGRMATTIDALEATTNALVDITEKLKLAQQSTDCLLYTSGFTRGMPRFPSMEAVSALPSPQTNAPAPWLTSVSYTHLIPQVIISIRKFFLTRRCHNTVAFLYGPSLIRFYFPT